MEITTVADDLVVLHDGEQVLRYEQLEPDTEYTFNGLAVHTLPRPDGELLARFTTVNDVHFGEIEAGRLDENSTGPVLRAADGDPPYPETMNRTAASEMAAVQPDAVIVKGDLSVDGEPEEWAAFEACYRGTFGDRLHVVRGNHDAYRLQTEYAGDQWIELPGIAVALLDTTIPGKTTGSLDLAQMEWLGDQARRTTSPVIVMGHHQQWIETTGGNRSDQYFGLHPDASELLDGACVAHSNIVAYTAGHTHRHRVRTMTRSRVPSIEIGCTKDFPGTWAEYRVYEGGILQVVHRMSSPAALAWSNACRNLYADDGVDYERYALGSLADRCFPIALR